MVNYRNQIQLMGVASFVILTLVVSGCAPLKKKFTREKKKTNVSDVEPVLVPVDYSQNPLFSQERYQHHYALWKAWHKEFDQGVDFKNPPKRLKFLVARIIVEVEGMEEYTNSEANKASLAEFKKKYQEVEKEFNKPDAMLDVLSIRRKLERLGKEGREQFSPQAIWGDNS